MDVDESFLDISDVSELNEDISKIQAMIRGSLVRKQMAEICELYEQIVQSIDGDRMEVEWLSGSLSIPVVRKRLAGRSLPTQSEVIQGGQQNIAISEYKSVTSVCRNRPLSRKKGHGVGSQRSTQAKVIGQRSDLRSNVGGAESEFLSQCFEGDRMDNGETHYGRSANEDDKNLIPGSGRAGVSGQRLLTPDDFHVDVASRDIMTPPDSVEDKAEREKGLKFESVDRTVKVDEKQYTCAEVQTEEYITKSDRLNTDNALGSRDPEPKNSSETDVYNDSVEPDSVDREPDTKSEVQTPTKLSKVSENQDRTCEVTDDENHHGHQQETEGKISGQNANDNGPDLPSDKQGLVDLRNTVIMELLWVQQAIVSRKNSTALFSLLPRADLRGYLVSPHEASGSMIKQEVSELNSSGSCKKPIIFHDDDVF